MKRIRLLTAYRGYKAGAIIEASDSLGGVLVSEGRGVEERQQEFAEVRRAEAAVVSPARVRTATATH